MHSHRHLFPMTLSSFFTPEPEPRWHDHGIVSPLDADLPAVRQAMESVGCRLEDSRHKMSRIIACRRVVPKAPFPRSHIYSTPRSGSTLQNPGPHPSFIRKECSSQRNNNDNSALLPAPVRLWQEKGGPV